MIGRIQAVAVYVGDPAAALAFWTKRMGFELRRRADMGPGKGEWVEVAPPGGQTHLVLYPRSMAPNYGELRPSIVFGCRDVAATVNALKANGVLVPWGPERLPTGMTARFCDPDGNEFLLGEM